MPEYCDECGSPTKEIGKLGSTRLFVCQECFAEKTKYSQEKPCKHEYTEKGGLRCIHCGK